MTIYGESSPLDPEAARAAVDDWSRKRGYRPTRAAPGLRDDPHVIVFADGCASWLTYPSADRAAFALAGLPLDTFGGATVARKTADLPHWTDCQEHGR